MIKLLVDGIPKHKGGIGTIIIGIVSRLDKKIFKIDFLSTYATDYEQEILSMGCNIKFIPPIGKHPLKYTAGIKKIFTTQKYNFIWINNTSKINIILPYYGKKYAGAKIIFHSHGTNNELVGWKKNAALIIEKFNKRLFYKLLDIPCACSIESAKYFYDLQKLDSPVHIVRNAIDVEKFRFKTDIREKMRKEYGIAGKTILGTVGRLAEIKNQKFLIDLIHELKKYDEKKYKLIIVGDGPLKERLLEYAKKENVYQEIIFTGDVSNVEDYLQMFDLFLLPSFHEGMPLVLVEAQTCGLKCLVSDTISPEVDIIKKISFLPLKDMELWVKVIINHTDEERSYQYKQIVTDGYDIDTSARNFQALLSSKQKS